MEKRIVKMAALSMLLIGSIAWKFYKIFLGTTNGCVGIVLGESIDKGVRECAADVAVSDDLFFRDK